MKEWLKRQTGGQINSTNAKYYLPLVEALARGEKIQEYVGQADGNGVWMDKPLGIDFSSIPRYYRIKPKLLECFVVVCDHRADPFLFAWGINDKEKAQKSAEEAKGRIVRFCEVLP